MKQFIVLVSLIAFAMSGSVIAGETASKAGTKQYFVNLLDGAVVSSPVKVIFHELKLKKLSKIILKSMKN